MKTPLLAFSSFVLAAGMACASPPAKKNVNSYNSLWTNSPFTSKPPPPGPTEAADPIGDWVLGGVSEIDGGYMVTIINKKNAGESQVIYPHGIRKSAGDEMEWIEPGTAGAFAVDRVQYGTDSWKDTAVFLSSGGKVVGSVKFDDKLLTPTAAAPPPQPKPGQPAAKPGTNPPTPPGVRQPRQRVLPPTPNNNTQTQRTSRTR
ncbi:hypothetical protein [Luteolibacter marinus]|uniref:hypothetical protein n=1 Tax=Luteolibacter marinus TaxID=2776705 RepID=UPI001867BC90|nr:hypothetical protein [Luteolibacter marinus]